MQPPYSSYLLSRIWLLIGLCLGVIRLSAQSFSCGDVFTDPRDGQTYPTIAINGHCWFAKNLNVGTMIAGTTPQSDNGLREKYCYQNNDANCLIYGGLYQWDEMMNFAVSPGSQGHCPINWHVATENEWNDLITFYGGNAFAGNPIKPGGVSGFNGIFGGGFFNQTTYRYAGFAGMYWNSTQRSASRGWALGINTTNPDVSRHPADKGFALSVRCVEGLSVECQPHPTTANAGPDQMDICTMPTVLQGNTPVDGVGLWYIISGNGGIIADPTNPTSDFSGMNEGTYVLVWSISTVCGVSSDTVTIDFGELPDIADAGPDQPDLCITTTSIIGNTPAFGTGIWTIEVGGGTGAITDPTSPATTFSGLEGQTYVLRWTITAGCGSTWDEVTIGLAEIPTQADAGDDQLDLCDPFTTLNGNIPDINETGHWDVISGPAGWSFSDPSAWNSLFNGLNPFTYELTWTIQPIGSPCTSTDTVVIDFGAILPVANAGADSSDACSPILLYANDPAPYTGTWSVISGVNGIIADVHDPQSSFTGDGGETYILRWTIIACGQTLTDEITITFLENALAVAGADSLNACSPLDLYANTPPSGTGVWSIVSGTGGNIADPLLPTSSFSGQLGEVYVLRWTVTACDVMQDDVTIGIAPLPVANAGPDSAHACPSLALYANDPYPGIGTWTILSGNGGNISNIHDPHSGFSGIPDSTYLLQWYVLSCGLDSVDTVSITVGPLINAFAGLDQIDLCDTITQLQAANPTIGSGIWTLVSNSTGIIWDPTLYNSMYSGLTGSTDTLVWTLTDPCRTTRDTVIISFAPPPGPVDGGPDQIDVCSPVEMEARLPVEGVGWWTIIASMSPPGGSITNPSDTNALVSGAYGSTYYLSWNVANNCDTISDTVMVKFLDPPGPVNAGPDQSDICSPTTLNATQPTNGTGIWSIITGMSSPGGNIQLPTNRNSPFTGIAGGIYYIRWRVSNICTSISDTVRIEFRSITTANAGPDQLDICVSPTTLQGNTPAAGETGTWTVVMGIGGAISEPNNPNSTFTGTQGVLYRLRWRIFNGCVFSQDFVDIRFALPVGIVDAGQDSSTCTPVQLWALTPVSGTGTWTILSGNGGSISNINDPHSSFNGVEGETYVLDWTVNGPCDTASDQVTIIATGDPSLANAGPDQSGICSPAQLAGNTPAVGTGQWNIISGGLRPFSNPHDPNALFYGDLGETYLLEWVIFTNCATKRDTVEIAFYPSPTGPDAGPDQNVPSTSTVLQGNTITSGMGEWWVVSPTTGPGAGTGFILDPFNPLTPFSGMVGITYVLAWNSYNVCDTLTDLVTIYFTACQSTTSVSYGGKNYPAVSIGQQCWLGENLNIGTMINGSLDPSNPFIIEKYCYDNLLTNCAEYGSLYQWDEAMQGSLTPGAKGICPTGWHIPTTAEWSFLAATLLGADTAGALMKEAGLTHWAAPNTAACNTSGFTGLPAGMRLVDGLFYQISTDGYFWSSDQASLINAWERRLFYNAADLFEENYLKTYGFSVRCLKD
ncbi:MAG: hypothetical protein FJY10_06245 [Bacteroidetes bacterium]|nr:hypothetical protein [Bacteroidota bacterium]